MTSRTVMLAGAPFAVPMLPIRLNRVIYPICRKLHNNGFLERIVKGNGQIDCSAEEIDDLIEIAFASVLATNPNITRDEFDNWPITPPELVDTFFIVRYQTGAWIAPDITAEVVDNQPGEAQGAETLLI